MRYFLCCVTDAGNSFSFHLDDIPEEFNEYKRTHHMYTMKFKELNSIINMNKKIDDKIGYEEMVSLAVQDDSWLDK